ncbi:MAG: type II toxin-antitoxin system VapC family toxin [Alphaproteobacteria bacterium]|nr:type II toxin-antitoxin system VapC family toxin [Alphaproteobacteria bacterium]
MTGYVIDASVAVKWLVTEAFSEQAAKLLDADVTRIAPELIYPEAANALWALARRGEIGGNDFAEAIELLKTAPVAVPLSLRQLAAAASRLAIDLDHPVYDCFYLALGMHEQYPVVTADRRFHDVVRAHPYLSERIVHLRDLA